MKNKKLIIIIAAIAAAVLALSVCAVCLKLSENKESAPENSTDTVQATQSETAADESGETKQEKSTAAPSSGGAPDLKCYIYYSSQKNYIYTADLANTCSIFPLAPGDTKNLNYFKPPKDETEIGGIPVIFDFDHMQNPKLGYKYPDSLRITCSDGSFCVITDGKILNYTDKAELATGYGTIYWNCVDPVNVKKTEITATYISEGEDIASQTVVISRNKLNENSGDSPFYNYKITLK